MDEKLIYRIIDYTEYPGPRYKNQGKYSGEELYIIHIKPLIEKAIAQQKKILINLDGVAGYAASFIDELFGNIVYDKGPKFIDDNIEIISKEEPEWINMIKTQTVPEWDEKRKKGYPRKPQFD